MHTRACIVSFPFRPGIDSPVPLANLIQILTPLIKNIYIITSNLPLNDLPPNVFYLNVEWKCESASLSYRVFKNLLTQTKYSRYLVNSTEANDMIIFLGASTFFLPVLAMKLSGRIPILVATTSETRMVKYASNKRFKNFDFFLPKIVSLIENLNWTLADIVIVYSKNFIKEWNLEKYRHKILIAHRHFVDMDTFTIMKPIDMRSNLIGFIGRLSKEKGIMNFIEAASRLLKERSDIDFIICGNGEMKAEIESYIEDNELGDKMHLIGWVLHEDLPKYLNKMKLLVIPSYTEGLPNVMVEAMACGTPVLATDVGAIHDFIIENKTGFILPSNDPESISYKILYIINCCDLRIISSNSRSLIEREFTYSAATKRWNRILEHITRRIV
jgi:glycosyltransferase involved in cell wall biosynthesis